MYFVYEAVGKSGRAVRGNMVAASADALRKELAARGLALVDFHRDGLGGLRAALKNKKLARATLIDFFGFLHGLLAMGMDMNATFKVLRDTLVDPKAKEAVGIMCDAIEKGFPLSEAMTRTEAFPSLVLGSVKAGEVSGTLEAVFKALESHYRAERELAAQVSKATLYPLITFIVLFGVMVGLLVYVVPQLEQIFPKNPPLPTKVLLFFSHGAVHSWWFVPLVGITSFVTWTRLPESAKARIWEKLYVLPLVGPLLKSLDLCNVFFNFSLMLSAGVAILQALDTIIPTITSRAVRRRLQEVREITANGGMLSDGFKDPFFPPVVPSSLRQGETTGNLDAYLSRLATFMRDRTRARLEVMATFIEPVMLVVGGGMLLFFAMGIFMPLYGNLKNIK